MTNNKKSQLTHRRNIGKTRRITTTAILAALAVVFMYLEFTLPFMPPFLKFDFSEIPALIASFALGPVSAIIIELIKNIIHAPLTGTMYIGEISNFLTGSIFVGTAGIVYKKMRTRKGALVSMVVATIALAAFACPLNYFVNLPLYESVLGMPMDVIVGMSNAVNPMVTSKFTLIMWAFLPFNVFKGIVISAITFIVYKPISSLINNVSKKD